MTTNRLGLIFGPLVPYEDVVYGAKLADEMGFESVWMAEGWGSDALVVATSLAMTTKKIGLGLGVINTYSRSPAAVAMGVASLDKVSGGRAILGLGVSSPPLVEDWHGMKFVRPVQRLREYVTITRMIARGERVDHEGKEFRIRRFKLAFDPVRKEIPVYVAALGDGMCRAAGEVGDGALLYLHPKEHIPKAGEEIARGAMIAGRNPSMLDLACCITCYTSTDRAEARKRARKAIATYVGGMGPYYYSLLSSCGFGGEVPLIAEMWRRGKKDDAMAQVSEAMVDSMCLTGSVEECRAQLNDYTSKGVKLPLLGFPIPEPDMKAWVQEALRILG